MNREPTYPIDPLFLHRRSLRAMTGETIKKELLFSLFEAARWAPSSYNSQPWRFLYAMRETEAFSLFFSFLVEFNQGWCKNASSLVLVLSHKVLAKGKPSITHSFDTGAAVENLSLQGMLHNLVVHSMQGFNYERAQKELKIPSEYQVEAMIAVGIPADKEVLSKELQEKEVPSQRKPLEQILCEGTFSF